MAPVLLRMFHKIPVKRITLAVGFDVRQRAFRPVGGCAENVTLLGTVLSEARRKHRPLYLASLDLQKAFDSVTYEAILNSAARRGLSADFMAYLFDLYAKGNTVLEFDGARRLVQPGRGVRQGDPLSPLLFNLVLD